MLTSKNHSAIFQWNPFDHNHYHVLQPTYSKLKLKAPLKIETNNFIYFGFLKFALECSKRVFKKQR